MTGGDTVLRSALDLDHHPIMGALQRDLGLPFQDFPANMAEQQAFTAQAMLLPGDPGIADVEGGLGLKIAALTDKQVGPVRIPDQILIPAAITRIQQRPAGGFDPIAERDIPLLVRHAEGQQLHAEEGRLLSRPQFPEAHIKTARPLRQLAVHGGVQGAYPLFGARRSNNSERPGARVFIDIFEKEKRQPPKMIAVQMADGHKVYPFRRNTKGFEGEQRGRAAIEQKAGVGGFNQISTMASPPVTERITRAKHCHPHVLPHPARSDKREKAKG